GLEQVLDTAAEHDRQVEGVEVPEGDPHRQPERGIEGELRVDGDAELAFDGEGDAEGGVRERGVEEDARVEGPGELELAGVHELMAEQEVQRHLEVRGVGQTLHAVVELEPSTDLGRRIDAVDDVRPEAGKPD